MRLFRQEFAVLAILLTALLWCTQILAADDQLTVIQHNAELKNQFTTIKCPKGTKLKVIREKGDTYYVSGTFFGTTLKGYIAKKAVSSAGETHKTNPQEHHAEAISKDPVDGGKDSAQGAVSYLGKERSTEFLDALYGRCKDLYIKGNTKKLKLIRENQLPAVHGVSTCKHLKDGDIVHLNGRIRVTSTGNYVLVGIYDEMHKSQTIYVYVDGYKVDPLAPASERYKLKPNTLVAFSPDIRNRCTTAYPVAFKFKMMNKSNLSMTRTDFDKALASGFEFATMCEKCEGKGERVTVMRSKARKCPYCKGTGSIEPDKSAKKLELMFRYKRK